MIWHFLCIAHGETSNQIRHSMQKHSNYLPLISILDGKKFVYQGSFLEDANGLVTLPSGELCERWRTFPN
jgi:hypothetical protein